MVHQKSITNYEFGWIIFFKMELWKNKKMWMTFHKQKCFCNVFPLSIILKAQTCTHGAFYTLADGTHAMPVPSGWSRLLFTVLALLVPSKSWIKPNQTHPWPVPPLVCATTNRLLLLLLLLLQLCPSPEHSIPYVMNRTHSCLLITKHWRQLLKF